MRQEMPNSMIMQMLPWPWEKLDSPKSLEKKNGLYEIWPTKIVIILSFHTKSTDIADAVLRVPTLLMLYQAAYILLIS